MFSSKVFDVVQFIIGGREQLNKNKEEKKNGRHGKPGRASTPTHHRLKCRQKLDSNLTFTNKDANCPIVINGWELDSCKMLSFA
ncbi:hypothetical protein BLOT_009434 [Blomia tropicalis]|nr:hypothetical protein BLOT_009434 [Blomia tropicalis]